RRWRAAGYTVVAAAILGALSLVVLGTGVWKDFLFYHLPKLHSGQALRFMADTPQNIEFNLAPFGIPFKLGALGLEGWGWAQAPIFGTVYTVLLLGLAVLAGRKEGSPGYRLTVWLAMLMLASLRSPYAAAFVLVTVTLLLLSMIAEVRSRWTVAAFVAAWILFSGATPFGGPQAKIAVSLVRMGVLYAFLLWVVLRKAAPLREV